jgi:hypothetical protein
MPFNNTPIDDLFRNSEPQATPDTSRLQQHWKQMEQQLSPPAATVPKGRFYKPLAWSILALGLAAGAIWAVNNNRNKNETPAILPVAHKPATPANVESTTVKETAPVKTIVQNAPPAQKPAAPVVAKQTARKPVALPLPRENDQYYIHLPKEPQIFYIDNQQDTLLKCKEGTTIKIGAYSLADKNGNDVTGPVTLVVQEYYKYEDVIAAGLSRRDNRKKTIAAGMVKFDAWLEEEKLLVKPGRSIEIRMHPDLLKESKNDAAVREAEQKNEELNISKLGWINYERFYTDKRPRTTLSVQVPKDLDVNRLISQVAFVSVQGVLSGYIENNRILFQNIPVGETAYFISIGQSGGKFLSCVEKFVISENQLLTPHFKETSPEKFRQQLELFSSLPVKE